MTRQKHPAAAKAGPSRRTAGTATRRRAEETLLKAGALQRAIFNSANFSSIATDAKGVIQIFNVGAERMLGYTAAEVVNKITPADISDAQEIVARAKALSATVGTEITPGFEALVFKASRGIEDIYELTYIRKDKSRFPAVVSVTALRDAGSMPDGLEIVPREGVHVHHPAKRLRDESTIDVLALFLGRDAKRAENGSSVFFLVPAILGVASRNAPVHVTMPTRDAERDAFVELVFRRPFRRSVHRSNQMKRALSVLLI